MPKLGGNGNDLQCQSRWPRRLRESELGDGVGRSGGGGRDLRCLERGIDGGWPEMPRTRRDGREGTCAGGAVFFLQSVAPSVPQRRRLLFFGSANEGVRGYRAAGGGEDSIQPNSEREGSVLLAGSRRHGRKFRGFAIQFYGPISKPSKQ